MTITLRTQSQTGTTTKGSTLTHAELDDNFIDLLTNKIKSIDVRGDTGTQLVGQSLTNEILQVVGGTGISTAVTSDSAGQAKITITNSQTEFVPASPGEIGATTPNVGNFTDLKVKAASSTVKELQLHDQDNSNYVGFKAPVTVSANKVWVLPSADGSANQVLQTDGSGNLSFATVGGDLVNDLTPQLGGNLDTNTHSIVTTSNANVKLYPNGSGVVEIGGATNSGRIQLNCESNSHGIKLASPPHSAAQSYTLTFPSTAPTDGKVLQTDGSGTLSFATPSVAISTGVTGLGTGVATFLGTPSSANLISAVTDETGTGALVFATSPTLTTPVIASITNTGTLTLPTTTGTLGYQNLPAVGTKTSSYTLVTADVGKYVQVGSGGSITIPNATFAEGDVIVIANNHSAAITITCTITDTYIGGTDTDKATVSLATRGVANILFLSGTRCIITGNVS